MYHVTRMKRITISMIRMHKDVQTPAYQTQESAGADLIAYIPEPIVIQPNKRALIKTGMRIVLPPGYEAQIRPRSGLALKHGVTVLNAPGTIDSDYRGEIGVILINHGEEPFTVNNGDRIAQMVVAPVVHATCFAIADKVRGEGGFGSTIDNKTIAVPAVRQDDEACRKVAFHC